MLTGTGGFTAGFRHLGLRVVEGDNDRSRVGSIPASVPEIPKVRACPSPTRALSPRARPHPSAGARVKKKHTVGKVLLGVSLALALVTGLGVAVLYRHLNGNLNVLDVTAQLENRPDKKEVEGPKEPLNVLVMGSDTRDGAGNNIDNLTGGGARSDTTILLHVSADRKRAYGVSIPRDSLVTRPDCKTKGGETIPGGTDVMWNDAFSVGGPACTIQQFEQITGVYIDHFVVVDFAGFEDMVDAIDGVEVCIPEDIADPAHGINIPAGTREIAGARGAQLRARPLHAGRRLRHRPDLAPAGVHRLDGQQGEVRRRAGPARPAGAVPRGGDQVADRRQGPVEHREDRRPRAAVPGHRASTRSSSSPCRGSTTSVRSTGVASPGSRGRRAVAQDRRRRAADQAAHQRRDQRRQASGLRERPPGRAASRPSELGVESRPTAGTAAERQATAADPTAPSGDEAARTSGSAHDRREQDSGGPAETAGNAASGWPRCSATCSPRRPATSGTTTAGSSPTERERGDDWLRAQVPPHHG